MHKRNVTRNLMVVTALVVVAIIAVFSVGCGGGSSTPTEPKPQPTPGVTPTPVQPSVTFVSATPPCGWTVKASDFPMIIFRVGYATNTQSFVSANLLFADGTGTGLLTDGATGTVQAGSGFVNISTGMPGRTGQTSTVQISMNAGKITGSLLATTTESCSFIVQ